MIKLTDHPSKPWRCAYCDLDFEIFQPVLLIEFPRIGAENGSKSYVAAHLDCKAAATPEQRAYVRRERQPKEPADGEPIPYVTVEPA